MDDIVHRTRTQVIRNIPIDKIVPNEFQPRKDMGELNDLVESIKENGIIEPILVRPKSGYFEIIAGERRYRAAMQAGVKEIPCIEHDIPDNEALEISIIENIQRKDLNQFEEAHSLKMMSEIYGYTHQEIAQKVSKSRVTITEMLRLMDLPIEIQHRCLELKIHSKTFLLELVKLENAEKMNAILDQYSEQAFSREEVKKQRKKTSKMDGKAINEIPKKIRYKFASDDKKVKLDIVVKQEHSKDDLIAWLIKLIDDIKQDKLEQLY